MYFVINQFVRLNKTGEFALTISTTRAIEYARRKGRKIKGKFNGDNDSSGGVLLPGKADWKTSFERSHGQSPHGYAPQKELPSQFRRYSVKGFCAIAQGYEDLTIRFSLFPFSFSI